LFLFPLVQYYKGAALLWHLEQNIVGSESDFDEFLRSYIKTFGRKILNTDDFIQYFESYFPQAPSVDWQSWLYTPGMPPITHDFSTKLEDQCRQLAHQSSPITNQQMNSLNAKQIAYLLNLLLNKQSTITYDYIKQIDLDCNMSKYSNCEIRFRWYQLCIRVNYEKSLDDIFQFLQIVGRMKFVKPLYTEFKSSWPEQLPRVRKFFDEHKKYMNPITVKQIEMRLNKD
jgi:leukotriene-A4 hydrolase